MSRTNVSISTTKDGNTSGTLLDLKEVSVFRIHHNQSNGKDLITIEADGELLFKYDANSQGEPELTIGEIKREIIFGSTKQRAEHKLQEIVENLDVGEILLEKKNGYVKTDKRDIRALPCDYSIRGHRCSTAYVDKEVSVRLLHEIIKPTLVDGSNKIKYF